MERTASEPMATPAQRPNKFVRQHWKSTHDRRLEDGEPSLPPSLLPSSPPAAAPPCAQRKATGSQGLVLILNGGLGWLSSPVVPQLELRPG